MYLYVGYTYVRHTCVREHICVCTNTSCACARTHLCVRTHPRRVCEHTCVRKHIPRVCANTPACANASSHVCANTIPRRVRKHVHGVTPVRLLASARLFSTHARIATHRIVPTLPRRATDDTAVFFHTLCTLALATMEYGHLMYRHLLDDNHDGVWAFHMNTSWTTTAHRCRPVRPDRSPRRSLPQ